MVLLHLGFWLVVAAMVTTLAALDSPRDDWRLQALAWIGTGVVSSTAFAPILRHARRVVHALGIAVGASLTWLALLAVLGLVGFGRSPESDLGSVVTVFLFMLLIMGAWAGGGTSALHLGRVRAAVEAEGRARAAARDAELALLRTQLGPHFLCNALNAVAGTIDEDPERAQRLLASLADLLRDSYSTGELESCRLAEELERAERYLAIERARFEDDLDVCLDVSEEAMAWTVPSLLLQPLLENAIRHGMRTAGPPLRVRLEARVREGALELSIENDGHLAADPEGTGVGLANTRARLEALHGPRHVLTLTAADRSVRLRLRLEAP